MHPPGFQAALRAYNAGRTTGDLAADAGVSQPTASQWLSGKQVPGRKNHPKLAEMLGVTLDELVVMINRDERSRDAVYERTPEGVERLLKDLDAASRDAGDPESSAQARRALEILRAGVGERPPTQQGSRRRPRSGS